MAQTHVLELQQAGTAAVAGSGGAGGSPPAGDPATDAALSGGALEQAGGQPLLFYSVRSMQPGGAEPPPLSGPRLEEDPAPIQVDPEGHLLGQVNSVEAGRVHGWACVKGTPGSELTISVYVDGVLAGRGAANLQNAAPAVRRMCGVEGLVAQQPHLARAGEDVGVGFVVPLPPLPQGLHTVRGVWEASNAFFGRQAARACAACGLEMSAPGCCALTPAPLLPRLSPAAARVCVAARPRRLPPGAQPVAAAVPGVERVPRPGRAHPPQGCHHPDTQRTGVRVYKS